MRIPMLFGAVLALALGLRLAATASARTVDIELTLDKATGQVGFEPAYRRLETGDKLRFRANDPGELVSSIEGMLPDGVAPRRQKAARALTVSLDKDGVYGFACLSRYGDGVVALYLAGKPANEAAAKSVRHPPAAGRRFAQLFATLDDGK